MAALVLCALSVGVQAGFAPLADPDLPSHLSVGEWILAHRAPPYREPFAWTRAGAPYYAYSWLAQLVMFALLRVGGPLALHLLAGITGTAIVLASALSSRALGLRPSGSVAFAIVAGFIALETTPFLRPQLFMHAIVPLAFLCVALSLHDRIGLRTVFAALLLLNALAASVHISFPVMAAPLAIFAASPERLRARTALTAAAATLLGWLVSPYGTRWIAVFSLNFGGNALTRHPPSTGELAPGFLIAPFVGLALATLPLIATPQLRDKRKRAVYGALWLAGLFAFARMFKALGPWWWCATPMTVAALAQAPRASSESVRRSLAALFVLATVALATPNLRLGAAMGTYEGDATRRQLPSLKGYAVEPIARWLERHMRKGSEGRALTAFSYGSYLAWRVPSLSQSIDGRTIFPDSAALPDARVEQPGRWLGPWQSADLAVIPASFPVAAVLDSSPAWCRVGEAAPAPWDSTAPPAVLWVRREWWVRVRAASDQTRCGSSAPPDANRSDSAHITSAVSRRSNDSEIDRPGRGRGRHSGD